MKTRSQPTSTTSTATTTSTSTTTSTTTTSTSTPDQPSPIFSLPLFSWSQPLHISLFIWHPTVQASLIFQPSQTLLNHFTPVPFKTSDPTKVFRRKLSFRKTVSRATFCIRSNLRHDVINEHELIFLSVTSPRFRQIALPLTICCCCSSKQR